MTNDADVTVEVSSLSDRRRIASLEAANADLEHKLAEAMKQVRPAMKIERAGCYHFAAPQVMDREERVVCGDCGAELNPYEVLRKIAHREMNFCHSLNALRDESKQLDLEVKRLRAQRSSIRSQIKKLKEGL